MAKRRGGRRREARAARPERDLTEWKPRTKLGRIVLSGGITTLADAIKTGLPIREPEIVDVLLPETEDEVLDVNMVQRMTDSGRRVNFVITCIVGNKDGYAGLGRARGREVGPAIRRAIDNAKLNMIEVKRGCGSWECGCQRAHSLPFRVTASSGSVEVSLKPAPQGVGLAIGDIAKSVLRLAGITDAWGFTKGHTKTTVNYALATFEALRKTGELKVRGEQADRLKIKSGAVQVFVRKVSVAASASPPETTELPEDVVVEGEDLTEGAEGAEAPETEGGLKKE
jgi:small subunit ribosomal protein S5